MYLDKYISHFDPNDLVFTDVNTFKGIASDFEKECIDKLLVIAKTYYNNLQENEKACYCTALRVCFSQ